MSKRFHTILRDMLAAYDNGDADDQRKEFIAGWATTLAKTTTPATEYEVLVTGDPFDGLTVEGPYPRGYLEDCNIDRPESWWIVPVASPEDDLDPEIVAGLS